MANAIEIPPRPNSESVELPPFRALVGRTLGGRYRVVAPLGRGGAGQVFTAVQEPLGREVAVKVLRTDLEAIAKEEFEARFLREAALLSRLHHPALVGVHDFGTEDDLRYVVMEKLAGRTLRTALRAEGALDAKFVARLCAEIARGLRHAHQAGLVHRDVKPNNVILEPDDDEIDHAKLIDFGLVKETGGTEESSITRVGAYLGTPAYMAPEQARGEPDVDAKADVYALGVMMYQCLTNKLPFDAETALGLAVMHSTEPYPPMALRAPEIAIPSDLEDIVRACLNKERADRPDAGEVASRLEAWLQSTSAPAPGRAVGRATPPPPARPLGWIAASLLVSVAAIVIGGGIATLAVGWSFWRTSGIDAVDVDFQPVENPPPEPVVEEPVVEEPAPAPAEPVVEEPAAPVAPEPAPKAGDPVVVKPAPSAPKPAAPKPAAPAPPAAGAVVADGVRFDAAHAGRALAWVNTTDDAGLHAAGILTRQVNVILGARPFSSLEAFAATPQIGEKTVQSVHTATAR